jgi:hypothetical protein
MNFSKLKNHVSKLNIDLKLWNNTIMIFITVVSLIYTFYSSQRSFSLVYKSIEQSYEQIIMQRKSIPAQLMLTYKDVGTYKEQAFIKNTGRTILNVVSAEYKYFFITPDYTVLTENSLQKKLEIDTKMLNTLRTANLLKDPKDITSLFGIPRNFDLKHLEPEKETLLEISPSSVQNATSLAKEINAQVITKWRIKYHEELSNKENIATIYIWMHKSNDSNLSLRENLADVLGGQKIIDIINNFEQNTMEVIFGYN